MIDFDIKSGSFKTELLGVNAEKLEWCPGNGTAYTAIVIKLTPHSASCGSLGTVTDGWLVTCGLTRMSHMLQPSGFLAEPYVAEKFNLKLDQDVGYFTALLRFALGR